MTNIRRITYTEPTPSAFVVNESDNTIWIGFGVSSGVCTIKKLSATQPDQVYYNLSRSVSGINAFALSTTYLYVAYNDATIFGERIALSNPLTTFTTIDYPVGVNEAPIKVVVDNLGNIWYLTPGVASGENAKLIRYDSSFVFQEIIDLNSSGNIVTDATDIVVDSNGDLRIVTNTDPATLVRVYDSGGYTYTVTTII